MQANVYGSMLGGSDGSWSLLDFALCAVKVLAMLVLWVQMVLLELLVRLAR
jgi:hypothetical protein